MRTDPVLNAAGRTLTASFRAAPVFVVGLGRSGTTVVKDALGAHREIIAADGESPAIATFGATARQLLENDYRAKTLRMSAEAMLERLRRLCFEGAMGPHSGARRLAREVVRTRKNPFRLRRWCAKTFPSAPEAEGLAELYPHGRLVYVVRNGCEVVQSRSQFGSMRERSFEDHCREWADSVRRYAYLLACARATAVRHEALSRDPGAVFDGLCTFIGVARDRGPSTFAQTTLLHPLDQPTQVGVAVEQRLHDREPAHESWTAEQRENFKTVCGDAMHELGYEIPF